MKTIKTAVCALAVAGALVAGKAMAGSNTSGIVLNLNVSGTAEVQNTDNGTNKAATKSFSINNNFIYGMITNALLNASNDSDGTIPSAVPPKGSYIAFNPIGSDHGPENGRGFFYVTNSSSSKGYYYALSGTNSVDGQYYSFMELDSLNSINDYYGFEFGFNGGEYSTNYFVFNGASSWSLAKKGSGSETDTSTALLYIHDDPYAYDDADFPTMWINNYNLATSSAQGNGDDTTSGEDDNSGNDNAVEIRGILSVTMDFNTNGVVTSASIKLTGSGNLLYANAPYDSFGNVVKSATATFSK